MDSSFTYPEKRLRLKSSLHISEYGSENYIPDTQNEDLCSPKK